MANELLVDIGKALAPIGGSLLAGGFLWKFFEKLLDYAEAGRKRRAENEGETNAALQKRVNDLTDKILVLTKEAAAAELYREGNTELKKQLATEKEGREDDAAKHERELKQKDGDNRQLLTIIGVWQDFKMAMDDEEGHAFLKKKMDQRKKQ